MRRRYLEILILIGLVALILCQGWKPVRSSQPIPEIEVDRREFDLNIHGVRPGMSREDVSSLFGEPTKDSNPFEYDAGPDKTLQVTFDWNEKAVFVSGESVQDGAITLLRAGDRSKAWESALGSVVPLEEREPAGPCEWFPDKKTVYGYPYPRHNLYIEARCREGTIQSGPIRAQSFYLSEEELLFSGFGYLHWPADIGEH